VRPEHASSRRFNRIVYELLEAEDFEEKIVHLLEETSPKRLLKPLLAALCSADQTVKWHAITCLGRLVADTAEQDMEWARNVVRRLTWYLNDESGGIGWGAPEAMGEIMARHRDLAQEFAAVLLSYIQPEGGSYLEYEPLQRGALWAIGRVARTQPETMRRLRTAGILRPWLRSPDPSLRGLAVWALGRLGDDGCRRWLGPLLGDRAEFTLYRDRKLQRCSIDQLARETLARFGREQTR
jgi:hypothetical protein